MVAGSWEERGEVNGWFADWEKHPEEVLHSHRCGLNRQICRKRGLGEKLLFQILFECETLEGVRQSVLGQEYTDSVKIRKPEIGSFLLFCQSADFL